MDIRPLGKVRDLVESIGFDISYAYDDLVFSDHSMFILRFDDKDPRNLYLYFNKECEEQEALKVGLNVINAGKVGGFKVLNSGHFEVYQAEDKEELSIKFY